MIHDREASTAAPASHSNTLEQLFTAEDAEDAEDAEENEDETLRVPLRILRVLCAKIFGWKKGVDGRHKAGMTV